MKISTILIFLVISLPNCSGYHCSVKRTKFASTNTLKIIQVHNAPPLFGSSSQYMRYSSNDWIYSLMTLPASRILRRISSHLMASTVFTSFLTYLFKKGKLNRFIIHNGQPWALMVSVLSLLLVFRTNSAYDRFWESRKLLGNLLNNSRYLALLMSSSSIIKGDFDSSKIRIASLISTFPKLLLAHVSFEDQDSIIDSSNMVNMDKVAVKAAKNKPSVCLKLLIDCCLRYTQQQDLVCSTIGVLNHSDFSN